MSHTAAQRRSHPRTHRRLTALWLDPAAIAVDSANTVRGPRPWVPQPHPKAKPPPDPAAPRQQM